MSSVTKIVSLSREQLHAMVWSEPMTKVAARFGITDVALRKKCVRHAVPVPGRGFWQQRDAGRLPAPADLPDNCEADSIEFCVQNSDNPFTPAHETAFAADPPRVVVVRTRADHVADVRQQMEERAKRLEAVEREERETRRKAAEEHEAVERLEADVLAWERAQRLRAYITAVASAPELEGAAGERAAWIEWAKRQADMIDPLCSAVPPRDGRSRWSGR